jgi:Bacterial Ig-like domain (group 3)
VTQAATKTTLSTDQNPSSFNQQVVLTASVVPAAGGTATGSVTFYDGTTPVGSASPANNTARFSVSSLSVGTHSLTARYQGDANTGASTSSAVTLTVNAAATSTTVSADLSTTAYGQNVTLTASVNSSFGGVSSGQVSFFDGPTPLANAAVVSGSAQVAVSSLSAGTHTITAQFLGNGNFAGSTAAGISHSVTAAGTATAMVSNANPSSYGQAATFTATVTPAFSGTPSGTVTFFDGGTALGTANLSGGVAALPTGATTLAAGTHTVSARYNGDSSFVTSTSGALTQSVAPVATTAVLASNLNPSASGQTVSFTAHVSSVVSGTLTRTVNFYLDGGSSPVSSAPVSGGNAQYSTNSLTPGTHSAVAALVSSNPNFAGSNSAPLSQTVTDFSMSTSPASLTISHNGSGVYTLILTPLSGFTGSVSLTCAGAPSNTSCSISPTQVTLSGTNPTQATVTVSASKKPDNGNFTLTLTGTSGTVWHSLPVGLTIN